MLGKKLITFVAGTLFGSAGIKILTSKDAKKLYTKVLAYGLRGYDETMKVVQKVQSEAEEVYTKAKLINDQKRIEENKDKIVEF